MTKREALTFKVSDDTITDKKVEYRIFKAHGEEHKLYHDLTNKRLTCETYFEFQVRRYYIKEYLNSRGRMIWFSTNQTSINNYKIANYALQTQATSGEDEEILKKSLERVKLTEELALKTNMQTYDKKKIAKFMKEQENKN